MIQPSSPNPVQDPNAPDLARACHDDASGKGPRGPRQPGKNDPNARGPEGQGSGQPPAASRGIFLFFMLFAMLGMMWMLFNAGGVADTISIQDFKTRWNNKLVKPGSVVIGDDAIRARLLPDSSSPAERDVVIPLNVAAKDVLVNEINAITQGQFKTRTTPAWQAMLYVFVPFALLILLVWFLITRGLRGAAGPGGMLGSFGKSRHRVLNKEMTGITFTDVAGIDEAKEEVTEIIEFLKNPKKFTKIGGRIPRGVLLIGEPGCGKTLLAKAIAGEADVPFFSISGSDFVEMFVGVGASRVRDLFKQAKDSAPCIIFLDEIDAVGRRRGNGFTTGGHDEREQTLNAILVEMDGFASGDGVIVIAATNRADVLDPALIRPGRFDRQITVPLPDVKGRLEILKVHANKVKLGPDVDLEKVARGTPMFSGADLAAIINEAAIMATMANKDFIEQEDFEEARDKVKFGRAKKSRVREKDENKLVAYHEAGHAVLQALMKDADPLHKVTIIPRGSSGGATFSLPTRDRMGYSLKWLASTMRVLCGGRIAEARAMGDMSSGASMDIAQVTSIARMMILEWGMSPRLGFIRYNGSDSREMVLPDKQYSEETANVIDEEVRRLSDEAYAEAQKMLEENWAKVEAVAEALLKFETLTGDDVHKLMRGESLGRSSVSDLLRAEARRTAEPSIAPPKPEDRPDTPPSAMPTPA